MMMKTAGGPGLVSPIDFGERKTPLPRWAWGAIGASLVVHGVIGVALYTQRFQIALPEADDGPPPITVIMDRPKPPPPVVANDPVPPAPTPDLNRPVVTQPTEVLNVPVVDHPAPVTGTVINLAHPVAPDATGAAATPDVPATRGPVVITNPTWLRKPSGAQLMDAYPDRAIRNEVAGSATLRCAVRLDGSLTGCAVLSETPGGYGFGRSALGLSRYFRMNPGAVDGQAVDGARVDVGVRFTLPD